MAKYFIAFFSFWISLSATAQKGQDVEYKGESFREVLADLESRFEVVFSYTADVVHDPNIHRQYRQLTLLQILDDLLPLLGLRYEIYDGSYIVIVPIEKTLMTLCATIVGEDGEALPFVTVYLPATGGGANSDENGMLNWQAELLGNEQVEFSYIGYERYVTDVSSLADCPTIVLRPRQFSFEEVVVKEYVTSGIEQSVDLDHMILRPDKIDMVPGLTDADVLQLVQLMPGVSSIDESATGLHVRGGTPDQNLILYDGIPIYNGGHFFGMISAFNPSLIDKVDVYRSGFGPNFGGRLASVIDIRSTQSIPDRVNFDAGINFTHGDASLLIPLLDKKLSISLGARKSYTDIVETPTYRKLSERVFRKGKLDEVNDEDVEVLDFNLAFDFNDYNAKILFEPSEKDKISFSYFRVDDNLNFDFEDFDDHFSTKDKLKQSSTGWSGIWQRLWNDDFESSLTYSSTQLTNNYEFSIADGEEMELELEDVQYNSIDDRTLTWNNRWRWTRSLGVDFGGQYADLHVIRSWQFDEEEEEGGIGEEDLDQEIDDNQIATAYLSLNALIADKFNVKTGLRWNWANSTREHFFEPRLDLQYLASKSFQLRASAGYYRQFMSQVIEFNDLGINQDFWVLSDEKENIPVAQSKNVSLGMTFHPGSSLLEIEAYYRKTDGLTSNLSGFRIEMEEEFEFGSGSSYGIDFLLKKRWDFLQTWISYSYGRSSYSIFLEEERLDFNAPHDRPHALTIMGQIKKDRWNVSLSWKIASGIVYTTAQGLSEEIEDPEPIYTLDEINDDRLGTTHRLDLSAMYTIFNQGGFSSRLGISLLNIYNKENIMSREYFSIYDEEEAQYELQARDRAMLRFTPNIVLRIGFG